MQKDVALVKALEKNLIDNGTDKGDVTNQRGVFERVEIDAVDGLLQFGRAIASSEQGCHDCTRRGAGEIDKFVSCCLDHRNRSNEAEPLYPTTLKHPIYSFPLLRHEHPSFPNHFIHLINHTSCSFYSHLIDILLF